MSEGRYSRLQQMDWWDGQRVAGARAVIAGAGALGNEVMKNLLLLGWGTTVVIDRDRIERSNLSRSVLFHEEDVGEPKASTVARNSWRLNPDCQVIGLDGDLRLMAGAGLLARVDVVFGCLDDVAGRVALSQLAGSAGCVHIDGGLTEWEGTVKVLAPPEGACYTCGLTEADRRDLTLRRSCLAYRARAVAEHGVPTTPTVASITAGLMVQQALKWIHGERSMPMAVGQEIRIDTAHDRLWKSRLPRNEACPLHPDIIQPKASRPLNWTEPWADILGRWREELAGVEAEVALHLPLQVLERWQCPACSASAEVFEARTGEGQVDCTACGRPATPVFANQVLGDEDWLGLSPRKMAFPPWTRIRVYAGTEERAFELEGVPESLTSLDSRSEP